MKKALNIFGSIFFPWYLLLKTRIQLAEVQQKIAAYEEAERKAGEDLQKMQDAKEAEALRPEYKWRVMVNTGAGTRSMNVDAPDKRTAEQRALTQYMRTYFNSTAFQLSFTPNPPKPVLKKETKQETTAPDHEQK